MAKSNAAARSAAAAQLGRARSPRKAASSRTNAAAATAAKMAQTPAQRSAQARAAVAARWLRARMRANIQADIHQADDATRLHRRWYVFIGDKRYVTWAPTESDAIAKVTRTRGVAPDRIEAAPPLAGRQQSPDDV